MFHDGGDDQRFAAAARHCVNQVIVHPADELERYFLWAHRFTLAMVRATAEQLGSHRGHHTDGSLVALRLTLRERVEMSEFG
jgi:hypothetical protein